MIFSHKKEVSDGRIIVSSGTKGEVREIITIGWDHPGGIQTIGKYLFVPCETDTKCKILIYDLEKIAAEKDSLVHSIEFGNHRAACLGITDYKIGEKSYYLLLIGVDEKYYGYTSEVPTEITSLSFSSIGSFTLDDAPGSYKNIRCQGFGLVTDVNNEVYMVAPVTHDCGGKNEDWMYLIKINPTQPISYQYICDGRHLYNKGGLGGSDGTHFVWGAGIRIKPIEENTYGKLILLATSRNIIAGTKLNTNYWKEG